MTQARRTFQPEVCVLLCCGLGVGLNYTMTVSVTPAGENFQSTEMGVNTDWQDTYTAYVLQFTYLVPLPTNSHQVVKRLDTHWQSHTHTLYPRMNCRAAMSMPVVNSSSGLPVGFESLRVRVKCFKLWRRSKAKRS